MTNSNSMSEIGKEVCKQLHEAGYELPRDLLVWAECISEPSVKQIPESERKIHGNPIPEGEVARGFKITSKTIHDELELWRADPVLSLYAPTVDEEEQLFEAVK